MLTFRPIEKQDFPAIVGLIPNEDELFLIYPAGQYPFTLEQLNQLAQQRLELTVACDGDRVVGFGNLYDYKQDEYVFLGNIYLHRPYRGTGQGLRLVNYMMDLAFNKLNVPELRLSVFDNNVVASQLYRKLGFKHYASEIRTHPRGMFYN